MAYVYLAIAIVSEVIATTGLKASEGFTKPLWSTIVIVAYSIALYMLSLALEKLPVGITYAIWSGLGIVLIAAVAAVTFRQVADLRAVVGMLMIIPGVIVINVFERMVAH